MRQSGCRLQFERDGRRRPGPCEGSGLTRAAGPKEGSPARGPLDPRWSSCTAPPPRGVMGSAHIRREQAARPARRERYTARRSWGSRARHSSWAHHHPSADAIAYPGPHKPESSSVADATDASGPTCSARQRFVPAVPADRRKAGEPPRSRKSQGRPDRTVRVRSADEHDRKC